METDTLNTLVSAAIWRAQELEARGIRFASQAWAEVSSLEGELAKVLPASQAEGRIARRGAVTAALKAGDYARTQTLANGYLADEAAPESLRASLREILEEDDEEVEKRFRYAKKEHLQEARKLARQYSDAGPFFGPKAA